MYTLKVLIVVVAVAAGVARPSGDDMGVSPPTPSPPPPKIFTELRRVIVEEMPEDLPADDIFALPPETDAPSKIDLQKVNDYIDNEINQLGNDEMKPTVFIPSWWANNVIDPEVETAVVRSFFKTEPENEMLSSQEVIVGPTATRPPMSKKDTGKSSRLIATDGGSLTFALKPSDDGYYDLDCADGEEIKDDNVTDLLILEETPMEEIDGMERDIRKDLDPKSKSLVTEELGPLKAGLSTEEVQGTTHTNYHHFGGKKNRNMEPIYGLPLLIAVCVVFTLAIVGFVFGWSALSKKAKAAAEVEYPAYGVTGPSVESSGDRKLAHSAHIYHYQHQKQQIMAMEKGGMDTRNGSVSDPESEEENDDGDYTVYECPGFATTGEMEVKNPMFKDEPTPGKSGAERPKPKE